MNEADRIRNMADSHPSAAELGITGYSAELRDRGIEMLREQADKIEQQIAPPKNEMKEYDSGAKREDKTGKGRCDLLPACSILRLAKHYEAGAVNHGDRNWEAGLPISSFMDSGLRHILQYLDGDNSEDHLAAAAWNICGAMWTEEKHPEQQDIPTRPDYQQVGQLQTKIQKLEEDKNNA